MRGNGGWKFAPNFFGAEAVLRQKRGCWFDEGVSLKIDFTDEPANRRVIRGALLVARGIEEGRPRPALRVDGCWCGLGKAGPGLPYGWMDVVVGQALACLGGCPGLGLVRALVRYVFGRVLNKPAEVAKSLVWYLERIGACHSDSHKKPKLERAIGFLWSFRCRRNGFALVLGHQSSPSSSLGTDTTGHSFLCRCVPLWRLLFGNILKCD